MKDFIGIFICLSVFLKTAYCRSSPCVNSCSQRGVCTNWKTCQCFDGFEGVDCSRKSCPQGPQLADIPHSKDSAHDLAECGGQGSCNYNTGVCKCNTGFGGPACTRLGCFNNCNNRGICMNLREAAVYNDGYIFNRTTTYTQWDADVFFGCKCDPGWSGADCSQRVCEYGIDPRLSTQAHETVTLICNCAAKKCKGKFKLKFMGHVIDAWMKPSTLASELGAAIMTTPGIFKSNTGHMFTPVHVESGTSPLLEDNGLTTNPVCVDSAITETKIKFKRNLGDIAALSFYANLITGGELYFETTQNLICDCQTKPCNGTFRLSFDSMTTPQLLTWTDSSSVATALNNLATMQSAGVTASIADNDPICVHGSVMNHSIVFQAQSGNVPRLGLYSSVTHLSSPVYYNTSYNTSAVLQLVTKDGRDDHVKLCNGIGQCDFSLGVCTCPFGWTFDADKGPCGKLQVNTSSWGGLARCPGVVPASTGGSNKGVVMDNKPNYFSKVYVSINPAYTRVEDHSAGNLSHYNHTLSGVYWYWWQSDTLRGPKFDQSGKQNLHFNMTSNVSAGPLVLDTVKDRLIYVDQNPYDRFIGFAPLREQTQSDGSNYTIFLRVSYQIFGIAFDAHYERRNLYWSVPASYGIADGKIYYANVDGIGIPDVKSVLPAVSQANIVDPHGIAIHYREEKLYWIDRVSAPDRHSVLRSCSFDGSNYKSEIIFRQDVFNHTVSTNVTDLVIDYLHNNTAFFIDASKSELLPGEVLGDFSAAIIATNLDSPVRYINLTDVMPQFINYYEAHIITTSWQMTMSSPQYLLLDEQNEILMWSDVTERQVGWTRFVERHMDLLSPGFVFKPLEIKNMVPMPYFVVGMVFDRGLGAPQWGRYQDCYGNGRCTGLEGRFTCECYKGFYGDCQARTCPFGTAWFSEPVVDEVAHDIQAECSNMGVCDRGTGECQCRSGFEGAACERLTCQGGTQDSSNCNNNGRCMSIRRMAKLHKNEYGELDPVGYGIQSNSAVTWDADMIHGCVADEYGYFGNAEYNITSPIGPALDRNICPFGYNTRMLDQIYGLDRSNNFAGNYSSSLLEIQQIHCHTDTGNFTFKFRDKETPTMYAPLTVEALQYALQTHTEIGQVRITVPDEYTDGLVCSMDYLRPVNITFLSEFGDKIPLIEVFINHIKPDNVFGSITLSRVQQGTTVGLMECSGNGECDRATGKCVCNPYQGTSDGMGNEGVRGDCGFNQIA